MSDVHYFFNFVFNVEGRDGNIGVSVNAPDHFKAIAISRTFLLKKGICDQSHGINYSIMTVENAPQEVIDQETTINFGDCEEYISLMDRLTKSLAKYMKECGKKFDYDSFYQLPLIIELANAKTEHGRLEVSTSFDFVRCEWVDMVNGTEVARHPRYYLSNFIDELELADFDAIISNALRVGNACEYIYERYMERANKVSDQVDLTLLDDVIDQCSEEIKQANKVIITSVPDANLRS